MSIVILKKCMCVLLTVFLCFFLILATGCENGADEVLKSGYVRFEKQCDGSRALVEDFEELYSPGELYWAYVAIKKDGLHTVGESKVTTAAASAGKIVTVDSKNYELRPVEKDYGQGLEGSLGPFAFGDWYFKIYGYLNFDPVTAVFSDLIYTGSTVASTVQINKSSTAVPISFSLSAEASAPTFGKLSVGSLYYAVPKDMVFYKNSTITVTVTDKASGTEIFKSTGTVGSSDAVAGTKIHLTSTITSTTVDKGKDGKFAPGLYNFKVAVVYQKGVSGQEETITASVPREFPIIFTKGSVTMLYGNVDDISVAAGDMQNNTFGAAVCYSGTSGGSDYVEYSTLQECFTAGKNATLLCNVGYGGVVTLGAARTINTNGFYLRNIVLNDANVLTVSPGSSRSYQFSGKGFLIGNFSSSGNNVWFDTGMGENTGNVTINAASDNVWWSGSCNNITVTAVKMDRTNNLGLHVDGYVKTALKVTAGLLDMSAMTNITELWPQNTSATGAWYSGKPSTVVGNINTIRDGKINSSTSLTSYAQSALCRVRIVKSNVTSGNSGALTYYGVEGMNMTLPDSSVLTAPTTVGGVAYKFIKYSTNSCMDETLGVCYASGALFPVGREGQAVVDIYPIWAAPVGGKIYMTGCKNFITGEVNGVIKADSRTFVFYDSSGNRLGNLSTSGYIKDKGEIGSSTELAKAAYYTVSGTNIGSVDNFYVYDNVHTYPSGKVFGGMGSSCTENFQNYTYNGVTYSLEKLDGRTPSATGSGSDCCVINDPPIGNGKSNTAYFLNIGSSGLTATQYSASKYTGTSNSIFYFLKNTVNSGKYNGYNDWYIPSAGEMSHLRNLKIFTGITTAYSSTQSLKTSWDGYAGYKLIWMFSYWNTYTGSDSTAGGFHGNSSTMVYIRSF